MKKKIIYVGLGFGLFLILRIILSTIMIDSEMAFAISAGACGIYFITLTIIAYIKNLVEYFKTGNFPNSSSFAMGVIDILTITSNKNLGSSIVMVEGAYKSSKEFDKANNKLGVFTYTLFYITLWSFLSFVFYNFVLQPNELTAISEILLLVAFISLMLAIFIILIFGIFANAKKTKNIMKKREKEYQKLKETNEFAYDLKVFKKHYAKPFYTLAYIGIIGIILFGMSAIYIEISGNYVPVFIGYLYGFIMMFEFVYLPLFFPVIIHTLKMNSKRQQITLNPLRIKMITKDGNDGYGTYEKTEKNYFIDTIYSYQITNRFIIINGKIESIIRKTENDINNEKNKTINQLKIPRIFNNENKFIEYLKNTLNK